MAELPHDPTVPLRLELGRERDRANAFEAALRTEVLKVVRVAIIQATIDADDEIARLKDEAKRRTAQYNGIIDTQLKVIDELKAEVERLKGGTIQATWVVSEQDAERIKARLEREKGDQS